MQMKTQICFDSNLAYLDHSLPPLGLFLQIKFNFLSLSQIHLLRHRERYSKRNWSRISKTPPFSHNQHFSPQEANFWQKRQCKSFDKTKTLFYYSTIFKIFKISQVVADPFYHFGLYFLPLWHQAPKRDQSWPFNPIASPNSSIKSK